MLFASSLWRYDRRHVFKVETIGDCYVAVTGIPHAQKDHAVIMVRFAQACLHRLQEVLANDLAVRLGPDVLDINMRVGLHSGPTTAGVLRGIKGRFQLFGDTVNTAAVRDWLCKRTMGCAVYVS